MPWTTRKLTQHAESAIEAQKGQMQTGGGPMVNVPAHALLNLIRRCELLEQSNKASAEPAAERWAIYFDGTGTPYDSGFMEGWKLFESEVECKRQVDDNNRRGLGKYVAHKVSIFAELLAN